MHNKMIAKLVKRTKRKAAKARRREEIARARRALSNQMKRAVFWPMKPCPQPGIEAYRSVREADIAATTISRSIKTNLMAYPFKCSCGMWHLDVYPGESEWEE